MAEIPAGLVRAEGVELSGVKRVEGFKANLQGCALVISREGNSRKVFEERDIPVVDASAVNVIAGGVPELAVRNSGKGGDVEPFGYRLGTVVGVSDLIRAIAAASAMRRIAGIANRQRQARVEGSNPGKLPSAEECPLGARRAVKERQVIDVVDNEHVPDVIRAIAIILRKVIGVIVVSGIVVVLVVETMGIGVCDAGGQPMPVRETQAGL